MLYRIVARNFVAGVITDNNNIVIRCAPIVKWLVGKHFDSLINYIENRYSASVEEVKDMTKTEHIRIELNKVLDYIFKNKDRATYNQAFQYMKDIFEVLDAVDSREKEESKNKQLS